MRPLWKGSISFGLVNIPVGLYSATRASNRVDLDMLRDSDQSRIRYKRVAEADSKEVPWEHIVKGFEYEKDKYVVLTPEDFKRLEIQSNQTVDIKEFVDLADIDPFFFEEPYYLVPEKGGAKAYAVLREALERSGKVGIAKVVIRPPREHLAAVKPVKGMLALELLRFEDELREPSEMQVPHQAVSAKELDMALSLLRSLSAKWQPDKYHDEYRDALKGLIDQKLKGHGKKAPAPKHAKASDSKVIDLVSILQESLAQVGGGKSKSKRKSKVESHKQKAA